MRRPLWLAGIALAAAAYGMQGLALAFGPLALVAPIVATGLLFALPVAARWSRRPMRRSDWAGCVLVAGGVALFLATSPPSLGRSGAPAGKWLLAFGSAVAVCALAVGVGTVAGGPVRASMHAFAAGIVFGLAAAVTLSVSRLLRHAGPVSVLGRWQLWVLMALGFAGFLLSVSAYRAGTLAASLPIMDTTEPVSGVLIGTILYSEHLAAYPAGQAAQLGGAAAAVAGIALLGSYSLAMRMDTAREVSPSGLPSDQQRHAPGGEPAAAPGSLAEGSASIHAEGISTSSTLRRHPTCHSVCSNGRCTGGWQR